MPTPPPAPKDAYRIKGIWLVTARRFLESRNATDALDAHLDDATRALLADPIASEWYPETMLAEILAAMRVGLCGGDAARFERLLEDAAEYGVHRFLTAILRISTPRFMLGRVPTLWKILRRGPATVEVAPLPHATAVRYANFPFFDDENYRLLTRSSLRVLLRLAGITAPHVEIADWTPTSLDVVARHH